MANKAKKRSRLIDIIFLIPVILIFTCILLIILSYFIEEWTAYCLEEKHAPIKFSSIEECESYMEEHNHEFGHDVACIRTDLPSSIIRALPAIMSGAKIQTVDEIVDEIIEERKLKNKREIIRPDLPITK